jgi:dTDP-4-dehydrorhamnose 3,5-epimerase
LEEVPLAGAYVITIEPRPDPRGYFARTACRKELKDAGLEDNFVQQSMSWNPYKGTVRGMHFQSAPHYEDKLVRVTRGSAYDVFLDMRPESPTFGRWHGVELTADNHVSVFLPKGFAHGYQILEENTEVFYQMSEWYQGREYAQAIRWDDPELAIDWPLAIDATDLRLLSEADQKANSWAETRRAILDAARK